VGPVTAVQLWVTDRGVHGRPVVSLAPWARWQADRQAARPDIMSWSAT